MAEFHHDEEVLGKAYDARLVRRLLTYVRPYAKLVIVAVLMLIAVAAFELAVPYLTRSAIDDHIVATSRLIESGPDSPASVREFVAAHATDMVPAVSGAYGESDEGQTDTAPAGVERYLIESKTLSSYDPREVARVRDAGAIAEERYYLASRALLEGVGANVPEALVAGDALALTSEDLDSLSSGQLREVRADDLRGVGRIALVIVAILVVSFAFTLLQINMMEITSQRVMYDIRMKVLGHLQKLSLSFFDRNPVGRLVTRATNDVEVLHEMFTSIVITILRDVFVLVGVVIVMLKLNWRLALVAFVVLPPMAWATASFSVKIRDAFREVRVKVARINASLQENISGMRVTQIFRREEENYRRFAGINHENFLAAMRQIRVFAMFMPLMDLASSTAIALVIWYGGGQVLKTTLSLGTLVAFLSYVQMFFRPLRDIAQQYSTMQQAMASSERIFMLLDSEEIVPEPEAPDDLDRVTGRISFENVWFHYVPDEWVLRDVSFTVEPGETVAIVGATGAGKTSIISLIERFYDIQKGRITLDGVDIRNIPKSSLRSNIGLVMQDVFIFARDIRGNIRLGKDAVSDDDLRSVSSYVNADKFIERLPGGYDEELGERGATLSTGQRQLLAFARALAFDPAILILDEATSNIDTETEALIQDALVRLMEGRTSIVIAHRLSTIQHADKILVMHKGKVREVGTHQELLAKRGYYYRLYQLQYAQ